MKVHLFFSKSALRVVIYCNKFQILLNLILRNAHVCLVYELRFEFQSTDDNLNLFTL